MPTSRRLIGSLVLTLATASCAFAASEPELGLVRWGRDHDASFKTSQRTGRPVLVLFDEVPGCSTCKGFGAEVLSNPLLVEAIESEFVPLFVANNRPGRDAELLAHYGEPAWNNPVVRVLDRDGHDLLPRREGLYSAHEIALRMIDALRAARRPVPRYLELAAEESQRAHLRSETFSTACYWAGEAHFGRVGGVLAAQALETGAGEAVRVSYDESRVSRASLLAAAARGGYTRTLGATVPMQDATGRDHLHALALSPLRSLELTPLQALRTNALLAQGEDATLWLTPAQRAHALESLVVPSTRTMAGAACSRPGEH